MMSELSVWSALMSRFDLPKTSLYTARFIGTKAKMIVLVLI